MTIIDETRRLLTPWDALEFEAPYLIEKLLKNCIADDENEAHVLVREALRYLVLADSDQSRLWNMYSLRVDEAWHQFVLFTRQYSEFCTRYFGRYVPHNPSNAPKVETIRTAEKTDFEDFQARYLELFGEPLPAVWFDHTTVTLDRRLFSRWGGSLSVQVADDEVELLSARGDVVFGVNDVARDALEFIVATGAFYVRELPGLDDEEKVALASALVECQVLRAAS